MERVSVEDREAHRREYLRQYHRERDALLHSLKLCTKCKQQDAYTLAGRCLCADCAEKVSAQKRARVVDARYENVRALYMGALRIAEDGKLKIVEAVVGQFPGTMWANLMLRMLDCAKLHGNDALGALQMAITEFLDRLEGK